MDLPSVCQKILRKISSAADYNDLTNVIKRLGEVFLIKNTLTFSSTQVLDNQKKLNEGRVGRSGLT
jgi:hypothetical protein